MSGQGQGVEGQDLPNAAQQHGVGALFGSLALKWTTFGLSLVVAMHISAAMCWHLYVVDPIHAPITCSIAAALASAACLLAGYGYDQRCMRALGLLVLALLQLLSCLLSIQRMLLLLGGSSHGTVVTHIVAYALPPAITAGNYLRARGQTDATSGPSVPRSVQFAAGTSAWQHLCAMVAVPWFPVAAYLPGYPCGWLLFAMLAAAAPLVPLVTANQALQRCLTKLLTEVHRADMFINLDGVPEGASRKVRNQMLLIGFLVFVVAYHAAEQDLTLWRSVYSAPSLPAPGPLASAGI